MEFKSLLVIVYKNVQGNIYIAESSRQIIRRYNVSKLVRPTRK